MKYTFDKYYPPFIAHLKRHFPNNATPGSKFTEKKFRTPYDVIEFAYEKIESRYRGERLVLTVDCKEVIGLEGIVALSELPPRTRIKRETREVRSVSGDLVRRPQSYTVKVAYDVEMKPTTKLVVIAEPLTGKKNLHVFTSIYPGKYAPDFSDAAFWNSHAFIKPKKL